jgi:hypothetical protein
VTSAKPILAIALAAVALSGCGGGRPFVLTDYRDHQKGIVEVCYDHGSTSMAQASQLADHICDQYDRVASLQLHQFNQCSWTTPDIALFYCVARPGETPPAFVPQKAPLRGS